ncbi:hypothetical protein O0L34_g1717 [Tuta absoluta]|nr:hypothetical protein O0L34_g1717 [Tuta absoluta]
MKLLCIFAAILVAVAAENEEAEESYYSYPAEEYVPNPRFRRQATLDHKIGQNGRVFGTLGSNDNGLYGKGGYEHNIFNDHRGNLNGQVTGTRVLGPNGASSHMGGALNWKNDRASASLEASKMIHGPASINAAAGGRWPVGKNGDLSAQGFYSQTQGFGRDYGGRLNYNHRF